MSPKEIEGLIFLAFICLLLLATHIAAVCIERSNIKKSKTKSLEGEN